MALTDTQCKAAQPKDKKYKLFDSEGLYLEVLPAGGKYWRLKYRRNGKEKRFAIGVYPKVSLLKARKEKERIKELLSAGVDPILHKSQQKHKAVFESAQTFEQIAKEWHVKGLHGWNTRYAQTIMYRLEKYTFAEIGHYPLTELRPTTILICLQKIEKSAPEMARRVKQLISHILRYAIVTNRIDRDLTIGLETALLKYRKGHFASIDVDDLPELLTALHGHKARLYHQTYLAIRLMLLTFVRTSELIEAKWEEIDFDRALWIPMTEILDRLGIPPQRVSQLKAWYLSPLRQEKTASFQVDTKTNLWYDFGEGIGGDVVYFVCLYLKSHRQDHTVSDALRWVKNMVGGAYQLTSLSFPEEPQPEPSLLLKTKKPIQHVGLINYLQKRGIPLAIARQHLKELHLRNQQTKKSFFALGFENEEGGFELRNPFFKGCLRPKAISFVRGTTPKPDRIHLFEGFMDYLSALAQIKTLRLNGDVIVLNSLSCLKQALPYLHNYGYQLAYSWMDNDPAGEKATATLADFCKTQQGLTHQPMNDVYTPHKDVNAWHMHQRNLSM